MPEPLSVILGADSLRPPLTGIGRYTRQLLLGLLRRGEKIGRVECFSGFSWKPAAQYLQISQGPGTGPVASGGARRLIRSIPGSYEARHLLKGLALRAQAPRIGHAVYHEPNYVLHPIDAPAVVSCHDLSFIRYPEHHPRERVRHLDRYLQKSLERAERIVTDSTFVRREVIDQFGLSPTKVEAVPLGVDAAFRPLGAEACRPHLDRHGLSYDGYLLAVATVEPRKNLHRLIEAYGRLPKALRNRAPLVIAGARGWSTDILEARMSDLQRAGELKRLGYVPEEDLPALYAGCTGFVYPSLYEGFGLPPLEAMASGVPVLTSNASSIPEVVGEAGLLADPEDVEAMTEMLRRAVEDEALRRDLRSKGPERAALFTWDRCVERTIEVYRQVLK